MVTDRLFRRLRKLIQTEDTLAQGRRQGRRRREDGTQVPRLRPAPQSATSPPYLADPGGPVPGRLARTRSNMLRLNPGLQAKTLFLDLQRRFPGRFPDVQLRCLQRRIKQWRALEGPPKEVFFAQIHEPGRLAESDFTCMAKLGVTIARRAVRPPGLSLRAHLLQLGGRHRLLLRELREPQRRACKTPCGNWEESPGGTAPIA